MDNEKKDILSEINRRDGMTVPDGFFEKFVADMEQKLPYRAEAEESRVLKAPKTTWEKIRVYAYLAAMFAGIWCMLKMFTMMTPGGVDLSIDRNHILTDALSDENFVYEYIIDDMNQREIIDEMFEDSISIDDMTPVDSLFPDVSSENEQPKNTSPTLKFNKNDEIQILSALVCCNGEHMHPAYNKCSEARPRSMDRPT